MKKICAFIPIVLLLTSCGETTNSKEEKHYDYKDYEKFKIDWKNLFFTAKTHYFVYIYSESCLHCKEIKDYILPYFDDENFDIFLIEFSNQIPTDYDIEKTIGKTDVESMWIFGVPTLIEIDNQMVVNNVAGKDEVLALLEEQSQ